MTTPDLIDELAANVLPVRPLHGPVTRAACWLLLAALILALLVSGRGVRPDIAQSFQDPTFVLQTTGMVLTGVFAAVAAFMLSLPDRSRLWSLLPAPTLFLWVSTIGYQCLFDWVSFGPDGVGLGETTRCFATLVLTSLPLTLAMLIMLRYAAPLRPTLTTLIGSLAIAAFTAVALSLLQNLDATVMILMWNLGTAVMIVGLAGAFGRAMLSCVAPRSLRD
jgi:hypothetical protein